MKFARKFILPLFDKITWCDDQTAMRVASNHQFLEQQPRHDSFARAGIISQQVAQRLFGGHGFVDGGDLGRQRFDERGMHGDQWVKEVGQADTVCFRNKAKERTVSIEAPRQLVRGDF